MRALHRLGLGAVCCLVLGSCAAAAPTVKKGPPPRPPPPPVTTTAEMEISILTETKKTAAAELECPEDQVTTNCTQRDRNGGCVAIQARGCNKTLEYSFGNE